MNSLFGRSVFLFSLNDHAELGTLFSFAWWQDGSLNWFSPVVYVLQSPVVMFEGKGALNCRVYWELLCVWAFTLKAYWACDPAACHSCFIGTPKHPPVDPGWSAISWVALKATTHHRGHIRLCVISTLNHMHHTKADKLRLRHLIIYCQRKECLSAVLHKCLWAKQRISGSSSGYCVMTDHDLWSPWISFTL